MVDKAPTDRNKAVQLTGVHQQELDLDPLPVVQLDLMVELLRAVKPTGKLFLKLDSIF